MRDRKKLNWIETKMEKGGTAWRIDCQNNSIAVGSGLSPKTFSSLFPLRFENLLCYLFRLKSLGGPCITKTGSN